MSEEIRCERCRRLLAMRLENGILEIKHRGKVVVRFGEGELFCPRCRRQAVVTLRLDGSGVN